MAALLVNAFSHDPRGYRLGSQPSPRSLPAPEAQGAIRRPFATGAHGQQRYTHFVGAVRHSPAQGVAGVFIVGIGFTAAAFLLTLVFPHLELTSWEEER